MIEEYNKYRAQLFQVAGLSLFAPLGRIFIDIKEIKLIDLNIAFLVHILISLSLSYFGIILIDKGFNSLQRRK